MPRTLRAPAFALAALFAAPALACDAEAMNHHLTAVCDAAQAPARAAAEAAMPHATEAERAAMARALAAIAAACETGDPEAGARQAAVLARVAGFIEARGGGASPLAQLAALR
ncbi:MAG: hypothetical protein N2Z67_02085 [Acetobacteraceae bacterium]|nr:hypothetical protein [Acetobacteraceae bacterium]